ncbi:hypothetical protein PR048_027129 [Dryococelus australis]|uniref:Uncharacterized protein n=1 Tax=Dryococelus australis TaxID=614101 RepID=A0ABQ9GEK7_9NEOP|nr:hypothetical protein PR048_027129 [Dryococelus australis]
MVTVEDNARGIRRGEMSVEQRRNERAWETGDAWVNPPTSGIVRHDSHMGKLVGGGGATPPRIEPGSPEWEAGSITTTPPFPLTTVLWVCATSGRMDHCLAISNLRSIPGSRERGVRVSVPTLARSLVSAQLACTLYDWKNFFDANHELEMKVDRSRWLRSTNLRVLTLNCFSANTTCKNGMDWICVQNTVSSQTVHQIAAHSRRFQRLALLWTSLVLFDGGFWPLCFVSVPLCQGFVCRLSQRNSNWALRYEILLAAHEAHHLRTNHSQARDAELQQVRSLTEKALRTQGSDSLCTVPTINILSVRYVLHQAIKDMGTERVKLSTFMSWESMRLERGEHGAAPECKGGGNGRSLRKPTEQRHRLARFPRAKIRGRPHRESKPISPWCERSGTPILRSSRDEGWMRIDDALRLVLAYIGPLFGKLSPIAGRILVLPPPCRAASRTLETSRNSISSGRVFTGSNKSKSELGQAQIARRVLHSVESEGSGFAPRRLRRGRCPARLQHWEFVNKSVSLELRQYTKCHSNVKMKQVRQDTPGCSGVKFAAVNISGGYRAEFRLPTVSPWRNGNPLEAATRARAIKTRHAADELVQQLPAQRDEHRADWSSASFAWGKKKRPSLARDAAPGGKNSASFRAKKRRVGLARQPKSAQLQKKTETRALKMSTYEWHLTTFRIQ